VVAYWNAESGISILTSRCIKLYNTSVSWKPCALQFTLPSANMFLRTALLSLSALAAAKEMPKDEVKAAQLYDTGIRHANNIALKKVAIAQLMVPIFTSNGDDRNTGQSRRRQEHTFRHSMRRSRTRSSVSTGLQSQAQTRSGAATSVILDRCPSHPLTLRPARPLALSFARRAR
jgi:hypothetical protein